MRAVQTGFFRRYLRLRRRLQCDPRILLSHLGSVLRTEALPVPACLSARLGMEPVSCLCSYATRRGFCGLLYACVAVVNLVSAFRGESVSLRARREARQRAECPTGAVFRCGDGERPLFCSPILYRSGDLCFPTFFPRIFPLQFRAAPGSTLGRTAALPHVSQRFPRARLLSFSGETKMLPLKRRRMIRKKKIK